MPNLVNTSILHWDSEMISNLNDYQLFNLIFFRNNLVTHKNAYQPLKQNTTVLRIML